MDLTWSIIVQKYSEACLNAAQDESVFKKFRRDPVITQVMEFHYEQIGKEYLEAIKRDNPDLIKYLNRFNSSDRFGSPLVYKYEGVMISPSTLRYVKVMSDLIKYFGDINRFKIAEIGSGYGGQCKVIKDIFNVDYHCIDLSEVNLLAIQFLVKNNKGNIRFSSWDQLMKENYDLLISVGAFTEMNREIQDYYREMIINGSKRGYIIGNVVLNPNNCYQMDDYKQMKDAIFTSEEPNTHPDNFVMYWNE
jgi:putative sugar O-methyltransferase